MYIIVGLIITGLSYCLIPIILRLTVINHKKVINRGLPLGLAIANAVVIGTGWSILSSVYGYERMNFSPAIIWGTVGYIILRGDMEFKKDSILHSEYCKDCDYGVVENKPIATKNVVDALAIRKKLVSLEGQPIEWKFKTIIYTTCDTGIKHKTEVYEANVGNEINSYYFDVEAEENSMIAPKGTKWMSNSNLENSIQQQPAKHENDKEEQFVKQSDVQQELVPGEQSLESIMINNFNMEVNGKTYFVERDGISMPGGSKVLFKDMSNVSVDPIQHVVRFAYNGKRIAFPFRDEQLELVKEFFIKETKIEHTKKPSGIETPEKPSRMTTKAKVIIGIYAVLIAAILVTCFIWYSDTQESRFDDVRWLYRNTVFTADRDNHYHREDCPKLNDKSMYVWLDSNEALKDYEPCDCIDNFGSWEASVSTLNYMYDNIDIIISGDHTYYHKIDCSRAKNSSIENVCWDTDYDSHGGRTKCPDCY